MAYRDLYIEAAPLVFAGFSRRYNNAKYIIIGAPLDDTASYRPGTRFAPNSIREASMNIESNGLFATESFIESVPLADIGNVAMAHGLTNENIERIRRITREIVGDGKRISIIGGEHTVTLGVLRGLRDSGYKPCIIVFDAHFDLRDEYLGNRLSHACVMRRVLEENLVKKIVYVGVRAYSPEEIVLAREKTEINYYSSLDLKRMGPVNVASRIKGLLDDCETLYLSLDIDGIDPAYAPGTGTPEPGGLDIFETMRIIADVIDHRLISFDIVEVNPLVDCGNITSIVAAKIAQEILLTWHIKSNLFSINK